VSALQTLFALGYRSVMVEGGAAVLAQFLTAEAHPKPTLSADEGDRGEICPCIAGGTGSAGHVLLPWRQAIVTVAPLFLPGGLHVGDGNAADSTPGDSNCSGGVRSNGSGGIRVRPVPLTDVQVLQLGGDVVLQGDLP
jgi:hypothetical protein